MVHGGGAGGRLLVLACWAQVHQIGPNSKFKFEFKKIKILKSVIPTGKPVYRL